MIKRKITKVIVACLMLLFLLSTGIFIFRGSLLRHIADKRITRLEQRYGLDISYNKLHMKGLNTISIDGLNVVPQKRDTLLSLQSLNIRIGLWKLLWGDIKIKEVRLDGLSLNFIKKDSTANYDFLFLPSSEVTASNESNISTDYTRRINTTLNLLFGLLPGNGELTHLTITERKDRNFVSFRIPRFVIDDYHFQSEITVLEDSLNQQWNTEGEFNPSERRLHATLHAPQLTVPYIHRRFGAEVQFDSLTCNFSQEKTNNGLTCLVGQSEVRGLQVYHKRLSPETINLDRGQLDFHVNVSPQAVELDSTSLVRFNALTFHPYLKAERIGKSTDKKEWHFIASVRKPWFPSEELFGSLPKGLFENLEGLGTTGQLAYHFLLDVDFSQLDSLKFESELKEKDFRILHYGKTDLGKMSDEFIYTAYENGQPVYTFPVGPSWENFTPLDSISP
ncbi:penicillin-binding protein, partial [Bacteroides cellulosilyticus]